MKSFGQSTFNVKVVMSVFFLAHSTDEVGSGRDSHPLDQFSFAQDNIDQCMPISIFFVANGLAFYRLVGVPHTYSSCES